MNTNLILFVFYISILVLLTRNTNYENIYLPKSIMNIFNHSVFRFFIIIIIILTSKKHIETALVISIILLVFTSISQSQELLESFQKNSNILDTSIISNCSTKKLESKKCITCCNSNNVKKEECVKKREEYCRASQQRCKYWNTKKSTLDLKNNARRSEKFIRSRMDYLVKLDKKLNEAKTEANMEKNDTNSKIYKEKLARVRKLESTLMKKAKQYVADNILQIKQIEISNNPYRNMYPIGNNCAYNKYSKLNPPFEKSVFTNKDWGDSKVIPMKCFWDSKPDSSIEIAKLGVPTNSLAGLTVIIDKTTGKPFIDINPECKKYKQHYCNVSNLKCKEWKKNKLLQDKIDKLYDDKHKLTKKLDKANENKDSNKLEQIREQLLKIKQGLNELEGLAMAINTKREVD